MPNATGATSVEKLIKENADSWRTAFAAPHSRSTQPLLQDSQEHHRVEAVEPVKCNISVLFFWDFN